MNFGNPVTATDREALPQVNLRKIDLCRDVVNDRTGDVELGAMLDAFQAGGGIHLHDLWTIGTLKHINTCHSESQNLGCTNRRFAISFIENYRFRDTTPMDVTTKLLPLCDTSHGAHDLVADDERSNVAPLAFGDELLNQDALLLALQ